MEELLSNINHIVVVGAWNKEIFTDEWVRKNILNDVEKYSIEYPISGPGSLRFLTDDFSFFIVPGRLLLNLNKSTDYASKKAVEYIRRILRLLSHTPVEAMGINFVFKKTGRIDVFNGLSDMELLSMSIAKPCVASEVTRHFPLTDKETLNFTVSQKGDDIKFDFNFNFDAHLPIDCLNVLGDENDIIIDKRQEALKIINDVYEINK